VGLYSPPSSDVTRTTPVRFQLCAADAAFAAGNSTSCTFSFTLNNLHTDGYVAYLFRGGLSGGATNTSGSVNPAPVQPPAYGQPNPVPVLAAQQAQQATTVSGGAKPWVSLTGAKDGAFYGATLAVSPAPVAFTVPGLPTHVRVSVGPRAGTLFVSWNQNASADRGFVTWAVGAGAPTVTPAARSTLSKEDVCALGPAASTGFRDMGAQFTAVLDVSAAGGLAVTYTVGDAATGVVSPPYTLAVPPAPGARVRTAFLAWADQGVGFDDQSYEGRNYNNGKAALAVAKRAAGHAASAATAPGGAPLAAAWAVNSGDLTYADGYFAQWEEYFDMMEPAISRVPLLSSVGCVPRAARAAARDAARARARSLSRAPLPRAAVPLLPHPSHRPRPPTAATTRPTGTATTARSCTTRPAARRARPTTGRPTPTLAPPSPRAASAPSS